jgi:hypothetical protein
LSHPAMQKLGCEPVRQPRSRWPSRPATGSTSGTWNWMRRARSLQRTCALLSPQTKGRRTPVCTLSQDWRTFIVRDVLLTLLGATWTKIQAGCASATVRTGISPRPGFRKNPLQRLTLGQSLPSGLRDTQLLSDVAPRFRNRTATGVPPRSGYDYVGWALCLKDGWRSLERLQRHRTPDLPLQVARGALMGARCAR